MRIAILGDGLLAAQAAATLTRLAPTAEQVLVPTGGDRDGHGVGPAAGIALPELVHRSCIADLLARVRGGAFSLGLAFADWAGAGAWFLPFGDTGAALDGVDFVQVMARLRASGETLRGVDHSLAALAAQAGRFAFPSDDPRSPLSTLDFARHVPVPALAALLRRAARATDASAPFARARTQDGYIAALDLADGGTIAADLYLDCSGTDALLIGGVLDRHFAEWPLPARHLAWRVVPETAPPPPYALLRARADGWSMAMPLAGAMAEVDLFAADPPPGALPFASGARATPWTGNCVAIGAAACLAEPIFGTPLLLAQRALERLARLLPHGTDTAIEAAEFNRIAASEADRLRDLVTAPHVLNARQGEPVWDAARAAAPPDALARRIALYASRGAVRIEDDEVFEAGQWAALLDGMGLRQRRLHPIAAAIPLRRAADHCARLRARLQQALATMPTHAEILATIAKEPA